MPVFNGGRWMAEAVDAILTQSLRDIELIISDNASSDETEAIGRHYAAADPRVRYVRQPANLGPYANHDEVFRLSRGIYFKWASCSDICLPGFFAGCVAVLEARPDVIGVYPKTLVLVDEAGTCYDYADELQLDVERPSVRFSRYIQHPGLNGPFHSVIRRSALQRTPLNLPFYGSDLNLVAELVLHGRFVELPDRLLVRRFDVETSSILMVQDGAAGIKSAYQIDKTRWERVRMHLTRFAIPGRAPIGLAEKLRIHVILLRRIIGMRYTLRQLVVGRLRRLVWAAWIGASSVGAPHGLLCCHDSGRGSTMYVADEGGSSTTCTRSISTRRPTITIDDRSCTRGTSSSMPRRQGPRSSSRSLAT
jgi:glycosyltransferase involved in cell wall biosynthesis